MGEARRRGTLAERTLQAIARRVAWEAKQAEERAKLRAERQRLQEERRRLLVTMPIRERPVMLAGSGRSHLALAAMLAAAAPLIVLGESK